MVPMVSEGFTFPAWSRWVLGAGLFLGWMVLAFVFLAVEGLGGGPGWRVLLWVGLWAVSGYAAIRCAGVAEGKLVASEGVLEDEVERLRRDKRLAVEFVESLPGLLEERGFEEAAALVEHEVDGGWEAYYLGRGGSE